MSSQRPPPHSTLKHPPLLGVLERLVIDHILMPESKDPLTGQTVTYILTLIDQASQWMELIPVKDCTARTAALAIQTHWISRYGCPKSIYSDLGSSFTANLFQELCRLYGIDHTTAASQNHKAISRTETMHRLLLSALRKVCKNQSNWCEQLPGVLLALRSSVVSTIGLSPAYMVFHRELRLPFLTITPPMALEDKTLTQLAETARLTDDLLHENTLQSFEKAGKFYNRKAQPREFAVGDTAYLYNERVPISTMRKLHCFYRPVEIVEKLQHDCYKLKDKETGRVLPFKVNVSRLKLAAGEAAVQPTQQTASPTAQPAQSPHTAGKAGDKHITPPTTPTDTAWHAITGILRRRRTPFGAYEYLVQWREDNSTSWLRAKDISPEVVRAYNARMRRPRRH